MTYMKLVNRMLACMRYNKVSISLDISMINKFQKCWLRCMHILVSYLTESLHQKQVRSNKLCTIFTFSEIIDVD